jgi:hypothetical protein
MRREINRLINLYIVLMLFNVCIWNLVKLNKGKIRMYQMLENILCLFMELLTICIAITIKKEYQSIIKINHLNIFYQYFLNHFVNLVFNNYSCNSQIILIYGWCILNFNVIKVYQYNNVLIVIYLIYLQLIVTIILIKKFMRKIVSWLECWIN